jgi:hypothetical protein
MLHMVVPRPSFVSFTIRPLAWALFFVAASIVIGPVWAQVSRTGTGQVVVVRELRLKPGASVAEFEQFVTGTFNPTWDSAAPGLRGYIAKGDRGLKKGSYAFIMIFDSEKTRNAMYPTAGGDVSDRFMPLLEKPLALATPLEQWIDPATIGVYTDYVEMR